MTSWVDSFAIGFRGFMAYSLETIRYSRFPCSGKLNLEDEVFN